MDGGKWNRVAWVASEVDVMSAFINFFLNSASTKKNTPKSTRTSIKERFKYSSTELERG